MKLRNKKTGEIIDKICVHVCTFDVYGNECKEIDTETRSLEKVLEVWEDYKPAEPLIKDEKIRKAVRAWAEVEGVSEVMFSRFPEGFTYGDERGNTCSMINWDGYVCCNLSDGKKYTIAELCGEEK